MLSIAETLNYNVMIIRLLIIPIMLDLYILFCGCTTAAAYQLVRNQVNHHYNMNISSIYEEINRFANKHVNRS